MLLLVMALSVRAVPECTSLPIAFGELLQIDPLGSMSPPSHTVPTDHMYWTVSHETNTTIAEVFVACDASVISYVVSEERENRRGSLVTILTDHQIDFRISDTLTYSYSHMKLSDTMLAQLPPPSGGSCREYSTDTTIFHRCRMQVANVQVTAGTMIGHTGATSQGLDSVAVDTTVTHTILEQAFAPSVHRVCFAEWLAPVLQEQIYFKWNRADNQEPRCGRFAYDVAGTPSGNWLSTTAPQGVSGGRAEQYAVAFVRDDVDHTTGAISMGNVGSGLDGQVMNFPQMFNSSFSVGAINTPFSNITVDNLGAVYCYEEIFHVPGEIPTINVALLRLDGQSNMAFQAFENHQGCTINPTFTSEATSLARTPSDARGATLELYIGIGVGAGVFVLCITCIGVLCWRRRRSLLQPNKNTESGTPAV